MIISLFFSFTNAKEYTMVAPITGILRNYYYLTVSDSVTIYFQQTDGFIAIANSSRYFINVGSRCNELSSISCVWNYTNRRSVLSLGTYGGVAQIYVYSAGGMRITIGYTGSDTVDQCSVVWMNIGSSIVNSTWSVPGQTAVCFFQSSVPDYIASTAFRGFQVELLVDFSDLPLFSSGPVGSSLYVTGVIVKNSQSHSIPLGFELYLGSSEIYEPGMMFLHGDNFPFPTAWGTNGTHWPLDPGRAPGSPALPAWTPGPAPPQESIWTTGVILAVVVGIVAGIGFILRIIHLCCQGGRNRNDSGTASDALSGDAETVDVDSSDIPPEVGVMPRQEHAGHPGDDTQTRSPFAQEEGTPPPEFRIGQSLIS
jgi:hypothetical protein